MNHSPLILSLETATLGGSVWLGRGHTELAFREGDPGISQSNTLLRDIDDCLRAATLSLENVDIFACASGPGSFTGLRIGIATLKALAATLNRPCIGIPTLNAVAHSAGASPATVALLPAGRGEVFAQMFSVSNDSGETTVSPADLPAHLSPNKLIERYGALQSLCWTGPGAELHREKIESAANEGGIVFRHVSSNQTSLMERQGWSVMRNDSNLARHVAALANQAYKQGAPLAPEDLHALYVRPSDAELAKQTND